MSRMFHVPKHHLYRVALPLHDTIYVTFWHIPHATFCPFFPIRAITTFTFFLLPPLFCLIRDTFFYFHCYSQSQHSSQQKSSKNKRRRNTVIRFKLFYFFIFFTVHDCMLMMKLKPPIRFNLSEGEVREWFNLLEEK